jgi:hypothetical protein
MTLASAFTAEGEEEVCIYRWRGQRRCIIQSQQKRSGWDVL